MNTPAPSPMSPFHQGEQDAQTRAGKRAKAEVMGQRMIRTFMPDQHREFFENLPFVVAGSVDDQGWPWASILTGGVGFMSSPHNRQLDLNAQSLRDDPLSEALIKDAPIGLLGIEIGTRRRNRMNATVIAHSGQSTSLAVAQSFGNCPQYIQTRDVNFVRSPDAPVDRAPTEYFTTFDDPARSMITEADTFFVASYVNTATNPAAQGVDVSHRGGPKGFVKIAGNTLTIPDYSGNNAFNTIGNFMVTPKAGLIFADFARGDVLMLTGTVEVLWGDDSTASALKGTTRAWRFSLDHGLRIYDALPFRAKFMEWSRNNLLTDTFERDT
ncbi:MAG: pyridoxamine 5'-phosphate oxidase family protein [Sulfitobacter sp.]